jgi:hypothetical protein
MIRTLILAAGLAAVVPAHADLTLTGRSTVSSIGLPIMGRETLMIKNTHLRRDLIDRGRAYSFLYDLHDRKVVVLDQALHLATVYAMPPKLGTHEAKAVRRELKLDLAKTGRDHTIRNWKCEEYRLDAAIPTEIGNEKAVFSLVGSVWLAAGTREQKELSALRKAAEAPDFLPGVPIDAKVSADQALTMAEVLRRLSEKGMICALDVETQYQGSGRMVQLAQKVATRFSLTYEDYSTKPIPESEFEIPAGYQVVKAETK